MFFTGHGYFNKHMKQLGLVDSNRCRRCSEIAKTAEHLLCECESLTYKRYRIFGEPSIEPIDIINCPLKKVLDFITRMHIVFEL